MGVANALSNMACDIVDVIADPSVQKGMPYSYYHGRTGIVFNVTKNAIGVEVNKVVGNRQLRKRLHVRIEHVRKSRCNEHFLKRVKENDKLKQEAKARAEKEAKARAEQEAKAEEAAKAKLAKKAEKEAAAAKAAELAEAARAFHASRGGLGAEHGAVSLAAKTASAGSARRLPPRSQQLLPHD